jgi:hypothetical protein
MIMRNVASVNTKPIVRRGFSRELMAIFGWSSLKMAELYARSADQKRLAESAMHMLELREEAVRKSPASD